MTSSLHDDESAAPAPQVTWSELRFDWMSLAGWLLLVIPALYLLTLVRTLVLGDPTEYTFVANILGIAHPPGYAFITVVGKLFQTLVPMGTIPWRMHLLSATFASLAAVAVYGVLVVVTERTGAGKVGDYGRPVALFAAFSVGTAVDHWQHAIHTNPHIITAAFLAANLFFLTKWWSESQGEERFLFGAQTKNQTDKWLYLFCISAGLGVTHHPLTVFSFPAYGAFILWVRPSIWRQGRTLLKMVLLALLGLTVWLYFPIRSPMEPAFGPSTMNTLDGFLDHVLARGLSDTLPYYTLADQPLRALVFWTLLRLQYTLPIIILAVIGVIWLLKRERWPLLLLYGLAFASNYAFIITLKAQDIMAYLLGPFLLVGLLAGVGLWGVLNFFQRRLGVERPAVYLLLIGLATLGPVLRAIRTAPLVSLRDYSEGTAYVEAVFTGFDGRGEGAVLLNDWEHMTPLWYQRFVKGRWPEASDVRPKFVSSARPWVAHVYDYLPGGPVYLSNYRRDVVDAGFRLRPSGPFYQVVEPGEASVTSEMTLAPAAGGDIEVIGYLLPNRAVSAGDYVPLTLAMRSPQGTQEFYAPVLRVGELSFPFTTDSHLTTPDWRPGEVIVERYDFALPHDLPGGDYPVALDLNNLSTGQTIDLDLSLGSLSVAATEYSPSLERLLANFRQRVGLVSAVASGDVRRAKAPWSEPLRVRRDDTIRLTLKWKSLAPAEESYTVFVHLIDLANRPVVDDLDYTPLGGASPTHLWIPKWLPGQQLLDPYRLVIPTELAPGLYRLEVGLYEMVGRRRLHISDGEGNLVGDRYILGDVIVGE